MHPISACAAAHYIGSYIVTVTTIKWSLVERPPSTKMGTARVVTATATSAKPGQSLVKKPLLITGRASNARKVGTAMVTSASWVTAHRCEPSIAAGGELSGHPGTPIATSPYASSPPLGGRLGGWLVLTGQRKGKERNICRGARRGSI